jgi:hypothetical protein
MRQRDKQAPQSAQETVRDIRRARHNSAGECHSFMYRGRCAALRSQLPRGTISSGVDLTNQPVARHVSFRKPNGS